MNQASCYRKDEPVLDLPLGVCPGRERILNGRVIAVWCEMAFVPYVVRVANRIDGQSTKRTFRGAFRILEKGARQACTDVPKPWARMGCWAILLILSSVVNVEAIPELENDWSRFVSEDGKQLITVGHHWSGSRPLNQAERENIDRRGVCLSCHQEIPSASLATSLLHHVATYAGSIPETAGSHDLLVHKILMTAAWSQVGIGLAVSIGLIVGTAWFWRGRRRRAGESAEQEQP